MRFQITKRGGRTIQVQPEFTMVGDDKIVGSTQWTREDGRRQERYQVLTIRNGKIVDMQGFRTRREADRFAHRAERMGDSRES